MILMGRLQWPVHSTGRSAIVISPIGMCKYIMRHEEDKEETKRDQQAHSGECDEDRVLADALCNETCPCGTKVAQTPRAAHHQSGDGARTFRNELIAPRDEN